jgi:hypothetical protein
VKQLPQLNPYVLLSIQPLTFKPHSHNLNNPTLLFS